MSRIRVRWVGRLAAATGFVFAAYAAGAGQPATCTGDCEGIRHVIVVMQASMERCDLAFPAEKGRFLHLFHHWKLLEYRIPGLAEALAGRTPELADARAQSAQDFQNSPVAEQGMNCQAYAEHLAAQDLLIPAERLAPYAPKH